MPPTSGMPIAVERHGVADHLDVGQPRQQLTERDRHLAAGQVRAEAEVRAGPTEADVRVRVRAARRTRRDRSNSRGSRLAAP